MAIYVRSYNDRYIKTYILPILFGPVHCSDFGRGYNSGSYRSGGPYSLKINPDVPLTLIFVQTRMSSNPARAYNGYNITSKTLNQSSSSQRTRWSQRPESIGWWCDQWWWKTYFKEWKRIGENKRRDKAWCWTSPKACQGRIWIKNYTERTEPGNPIWVQRVKWGLEPAK